MIDIQAIRDRAKSPDPYANLQVLDLCDEVDRLRETLEIVQIGVTGYVTLEESKCLYDEIESALYPPEDKP